MGSVMLECPLCCNESFSSYKALKYHLLSITENLICPSCEKRCEGISDLVDHLDRECNDEIEMDGSEPQITKKSKSVSANENNEIKREIEDQVDNFSVSNSILAKALLNKSPNVTCKKIKTPEDEVQNNEDVYYCSSCNISFTSIEDHLKEFHEGHEVFMEDSDQTETVENESVLTYVTDDGTAYLLEGDQTIIINGEVADGSDVEKRIGKTVEQEDICDKDGRLYTRKIVKIEKFWNEQNEIKEPPSVKRFIVVGKGNVEQVNDEELSDFTENVVEVFVCNKCSVQFSKLELYYKHKCDQDLASNEENVEQKLPGTLLETLNSAESRDYQCSQCDACFTNSKSLCVHTKMHRMQQFAPEQNGPFVCTVCNTEFPAYKSLRLHKRMHEPVKIKEIEAPVKYGILGVPNKSKNQVREMFVCPICKKTYNKEYEEAHKKFHSDETEFNCEVCNRKFFTAQNLQMHTRVHTNGRKFTCSYCKKGFLTYENLQAHVKNNCQNRLYECRYCGRRFARPHEKVKHERIHTGEKPHICEICGKAFRVSYCLTLHMRTHSGARPYQCPKCGKRFKAHSVYNHHLLTHSDVRAYKCPYCPKAFKTGVQLAGHKNSHIKPFTCTECNRPFASLYAVRAHMQSHQRENNLKFICWLCGASYARNFALRDHVKEQHGNEMLNKVDPENLESEYEMVEEDIDASDNILVEGGEMLVELVDETVELTEHMSTNE